MNQEELRNYMSFSKDGKRNYPFSSIQLNDSFILAVYPGAKSPNDIIVKYRQKLRTGKWSQIRTPKHIHWTVDILIKLSHDKVLTKQFVEELTQILEQLEGLKNPKQRDSLSLEEILKYDQPTIEKFKKLSKYGEYNVKFLVLLAKLLSLQEKTNYPEGTLFEGLLAKLEEGEDLFSIIQRASIGKIK